MKTAERLRSGTRASALARWQTARVAEALRERTGAATEEVLVSTEGDRDQVRPLPEIGGKGVFTEALEAALRAGTIDFAVHSLKDLPTEIADDLVVPAVFFRTDPRDVLIAAPGTTLTSLPPGAQVGTSSTRRAAQLRAVRPDLTLLPLRGNVDTRVRKVRLGAYDAVVIAAAGVLRLGLEDAIADYLPFDTMLPAPGQGALAVQCRAADEATRNVLASLDDLAVHVATDAERAFLDALGGGCAAPIAALAEPSPSQNGEFRLRGLVASEDGRELVRVDGHAPLEDLVALARRLAQQAIDAGARSLLT
ncbi:MAG TPA: hydroxymethylbilane synthase [Gemmatimonadales bacterium]|nr:hydroxymethylbilane synthase [Gemmatimonadales bacterium]